MTQSRPNILWITLDSVRADHTSLHGYRRDTTPEISRIAADPNGVRFEHAIAQSTRTPVSVPSMLAGLYPSRHRMLGTRTGNVFPDSMATAPDLLSGRGYRTIGISENGYAGQAKGLDERFDDFTKSSPSSFRDFFSHELGRSLVKYGFKTREHGPGLTLDVKKHGEQRSFFTTDIAKRKLRRASRADEPFFCYVHYNDTHHEYIPPLSYRNEYVDEIDVTANEAIEFGKEVYNERLKLTAKGLPFSDEEWERLHAMYDAAIKYTDSCVGKLFDFVRKEFEETIVVITSDHGDLFGECGLIGHQIVLHDGLVHVPLVAHGLDDVAYHADRPTQHVDVMQTLLSIAGADTSQFQGYDLRHRSREVAISQDLRRTVDDDDAQNYEEIRKHDPDVDLSHLPESLLTAVRTTEFKFLHTEEWTKLYRLPDESVDVKEEYPTVHEELASFTKEWLETEGEPFEAAPEQAELSEEMERHLQDMGYL